MTENKHVIFLYDASQNDTKFVQVANVKKKESFSGMFRINMTHRWLKILKHPNDSIEVSKGSTYLK